MGFTVAASGFVARSLRNHLVPIERHLVGRDQPADAQISPGVIAGIAIGCASFVLLAVLAVAVPILYIRYLKKLDQHNRNTIAVDASNANESLYATVQPRKSLRRSMIMSPSPPPAWGALQSQEDVLRESSDEQSRPEKAKYSFLSWSTSKKQSKKQRLLAKRSCNSDLCAIPEADQPHPEIPSYTNGLGEADSAGTQVLSNVDRTSEEAQTQREVTAEPMAALESHPDIPHGRNNSDTFSASDLVPTAGTAEQDESVGVRPSRSPSNTTMFANFSQEMGLDHASYRSEVNRFSRTSSLKSRPGTAPDEPLPPLPSASKRKAHEQQRAPFRPSSTGSASTVNSMATSIMNSPPRSVDGSGDRDQRLSSAESMYYKSTKDAVTLVGTDRTRDPARLLASDFFPSSTLVSSARPLNGYEAQRYSMRTANTRFRAKTNASATGPNVMGAISISRPGSSAIRTGTSSHGSNSKGASEVRRSRSAGQLTSFASSELVPGQDSGKNSGENEESVSVQILNADSSPGGWFQWVVQAVGKKAPLKSRIIPLQTPVTGVPEQDSEQSAQHNTLLRQPTPCSMELVQHELNKQSESQRFQQSPTEPKPSIEETASSAPSIYHSHQTSSASRSPDWSFATSPNSRNETDTVFRKPTPNIEDNQQRRHISFSISSSQREATLAEETRMSSPESSQTSEEDWASSPPPPQSQTLPSSNQFKTVGGSRLSLVPVPAPSRGGPTPSSSANRIPRKPIFGPPRSQLTTTPRTARALQPINRSAQASGVRARASYHITQASQQSISERLHDQGKNCSEDKENDVYRKGGGMWIGLDDLEDFWGTSEGKGSPEWAATGKESRRHSRQRTEEQVSQGSLNAKYTSASASSEGEESLGESDFF